MTLWRLPAILLLSLAATAGSAPSTDLSPPTVGILLRFDRPPSKGYVNQLRREVEHIFRPARLEFRWEVDKHKTGVYHRVVIVEMRGQCNSTRVNDFAEQEVLRSAPLGWTLVNDGEVIPHSVIDCDQIGRAVSMLRRVFNRPLLGHLYFRMSGRVLAHELMHALLETTDHEDADFTRSPLKAEDLQAAPRLKPSQIMALQRLGRASSGVSVAKK